MITFEHAERLWALLLLPALGYAQYRWKKSLFPFPFSIWRHEGFSPSLTMLRVSFLLKELFFWMGLVLAILAWAGPTHTTKEKRSMDRGADIMILLDESPSMAAKDFQPENRFEAARSVIRKFLATRTHDSVGLVSFALEAALRVPLTTDYGYFLEQLDSLSIMDLGDGTALGMGIAVGILHLKESPATEKVMILLTDGKQNAGDLPPETAASLAGQLGIRIYAVGIGTQGETYIDFTNPKTGFRYRGTLEGGFDESMLQTIASRSGGAYFYAGDPSTLSSVFRVIDRLERKDTRFVLEVKKVSLHSPYALVAFGFLSLAVFLRIALFREIL